MALYAAAGKCDRYDSFTKRSRHEKRKITCGVFLGQDLLALGVLHVEVRRHLAGDGVGREALVFDAVVEVTVDALHAARERRRAGLQLQ